MFGGNSMSGGGRGYSIGPGVNAGQQYQSNANGVPATAYTGGGDFWGAVIGGLVTLGTTWYQNEEAKKEATRNRNFQRDMANSAYQRQIRDLKAAGLNPMLSMGGGGASSPSGGMAPIENIGSGAITSALDALRLKKDMELAEANMRNQTLSTLSTASLQAKQGIAAEASALQSTATAKNASLNNEVLQSSMPALKTEAGTRLRNAEFDRDTQAYDAIIRKVNAGTAAVGGILNMVPSINSAKKAIPSWQGVGKDGTKYHKKTGEILP